MPEKPGEAMDVLYKIAVLLIGNRQRRARQRPPFVCFDEGNRPPLRDSRRGGAFFALQKTLPAKIRRFFN